MARPILLSDEDLYQLTGSWEEAALLRDELNNAINQYDWAQPAAPAAVAATPAAVAEPAAVEEPATPTRTYSSTDEQGNPIYEDVVTAPAVVTPAGALATAVSAPAVETPVGGLSAVTGGKSSVLEDTSSSDAPVVTTPVVTTPVVTTPVVTAPVVTTPTTTGALAQATSADTDVTPPKSTGALAQATPTDTKAASSTVSIAGKDVTVSNAAVDKVAAQILAQGTTSKWTGEGFGSAEANAKAMAQQLVANDITDINQVGKVDKKVDVAVTPKYTYTDSGQVDQDGVPITTATLVGYVDKDGKAVDPALVKTEQIYDGGDSGTSTTSYVAPIGTVSVIGNKVTGKELTNDYGERGGVGDAWSGTYAGKGNTAFRTTFDASGKPIFYTTGASSSDVGDLAPLLAIAQFIPGVAPFAMAINAAIAIDSGDVLGGLASLAGVAGFSDVRRMNADLAPSLAHVFRSALRSGLLATIDDRDIRASLREGPGDARADPAAAAEYHCASIRERSHPVLPVLSRRAHYCVLQR
jgi:hypothetical protein